MAAFQVETGIATGRGFDANGLLGKLRTFMTAPNNVINGGAGWYEVDNSQVGAGTNPYVVFSDVNAPGPNDVAKYVQVMLPTATAGIVQLRFFSRWDSTLHVGYNQYFYQAVATLDASDFIYDFRGGPEFMMVSTRTAGTWNHAGIDEWYGIDNLVEPLSVSGILNAANYSGTAASQFSGLSITAGFTNAVDANRITYGRITFVSGTTWRFDLYASSARTTVVATTTFAGVTAGNFSLITLAASGGSGVTAQVRLSGVTAAGDIDFNLGTLTLQPGQAASFTPGRYYFISDFATRNAVNFFRVNSISGNDLIVEYGNNAGIYRPFASGARISAYSHRHIAFGYTTSSGQWWYRFALPYYSALSNIARFHNGVQNGFCEVYGNNSDSVGTTFYQCPSAAPSWENNFIDRSAPDYKGDYGDQDIGICEHNLPGSANSGQFAYPSGRRPLGATKNLKVTARSDLTQMSTGMPIEGINYLYMNTTGIFGNAPATQYVLVRDQESLS